MSLLGAGYDSGDESGEEGQQVRLNMSARCGHCDVQFLIGSSEAPDALVSDASPTSGAADALVSDASPTSGDGLKLRALNEAGGLRRIQHLITHSQPQWAETKFSQGWLKGVCDRFPSTKTDQVAASFPGCLQGGDPSDLALLKKRKATSVRKRVREECWSMQKNMILGWISDKYGWACWDHLRQEAKIEWGEQHLKQSLWDSREYAIDCR